ncbi:retroviral-like aspartic protease family protein [Alicyclobacillus mali]|uniref:Retroviral-like aspartic protease family protein n=1 Tax=Alicyclobacillus mali (ex Roth et al. 2021) TaxID=1123961 RepID=A0ABS0F1D0_9BACL|nr:retropepsin-like aspartic protease [Alicyclobacillus mali (ex Roth et al. 2021)]MBF8377100.1 retroviral-like aspartic protease family protein [Alicyclobacillus mali (ex Roth et al. 2021)]
MISRRSWLASLASFALACAPLAAPMAQAATRPSSSVPHLKVAPGHVRVIIHGKLYDAICVGNDTYVDEAAFNAFGTPYVDLGNGNIALTGRNVQGVVYYGKTYVPWSALAPSVRAIPLKGGGFEFVSEPVKHSYSVLIQASQAVAGSVAVLNIVTLDGDNPVPGQAITLSSTGFSELEPSAGASSLQVSTDGTGTWQGGLTDSTAETVYVNVTWKTPTGGVVHQSLPVQFQTAKANSSVSPTLGSESVLVQTPVTFYQNGVFLQASSGTNLITFQLDTGAFETLLGQQLATSLHLPNLGSIEVGGIGGTDEAYLSKVTLKIGNRVFADVPCIVDPSWTGIPLLGYQFFQQNGYDLLVSQSQNTLYILK